MIHETYPLASKLLSKPRASGDDPPTAKAVVDELL